MRAGSGGAPVTSRVSLKFRDCGVEAGYTSERKRHLIERSVTLAHLAIGMAIMAVGVLTAILLTASHAVKDAGELAQGLQVAQLIGIAAFGIIMLLFRAALGQSFLMERISPAVLEAILIALMVVCMCVSVLDTPPVLSKIMGYSLKDYQGESVYDSDSGTLLTILGVSTAAHQGLPVRWCVLAVLEVVAILLYVITAVVIGSEEPPTYVFFNIFLLSCLVAASALGKRSAELDERFGFVELLQERGRRYNAEFQLSEAIDGMGQPERHEVDHAAASQRDTTSSGVVFDPLSHDMDLDVPTQLARVAEVSRAEHWNVEEEHLKIIEHMELGRGGFGTVYAGVHCGMLVAVKCPRAKLDHDSMGAFSDVCNELRVMRYLRHPNIVTTFGALVVPSTGQIAVVLELIEGVQLQELLLRPRQSAGHPSLLARFQIMLGICQALLYMHVRSPPIVHGDLKGSNIMVRISGEDMQPKLLDFGLSRVLKHNVRPLGGTLAWLAPEVMDSKGPVKCSADVYSFGLVIAFTATSIRPMLGMNARQIKRALRRGRPPLPSWPSTCAFTLGCRTFVNMCLNPREDLRPDIPEVYRRLLKLPEQEALSAMQGPFVEKVRILARQSGQLAADDVAEQPQEETQAVDVQNAQMVKKTSLSALPEQSLLTEDSMDLGSQPSPRPVRLRPLPAMQETTSSACEASLINAVRRWNYAKPRKFCCERHAVANLTIQILKEWMSQPCTLQRFTRPSEPAQCPSCKILYVSGEKCDLCGAAQVEEEQAEEQSEDHDDDYSSVAGKREQVAL